MNESNYPTIASGQWSWNKGMAGGDQVSGIGTPVQRAMCIPLTAEVTGGWHSRFLGNTDDSGVR